MDEAVRTLSGAALKYQLFVFQNLREVENDAEYQVR